MQNDIAGLQTALNTIANMDTQIALAQESDALRQTLQRMIDANVIIDRAFSDLEVFAQVSPLMAEVVMVRAAVHVRASMCMRACV